MRAFMFTMALLAATAQAAPVTDPYQLVAYRGTLQQSGAAYTKPVAMTFRLIDAVGNTRYTEVLPVVQPAADGSFSVALGANGSDGPSSVAIGTQLRKFPSLSLEIEVSDGVNAPVILNGAQQLLSAPLAANAELASSVIDGSIGLSSLSPAACPDDELLEHVGGSWQCSHKVKSFTANTLSTNTLTATNFSTVVANINAPANSFPEALQTGGAGTGLGIVSPSAGNYWSITPFDFPSGPGVPSPVSVLEFSFTPVTQPLASPQPVQVHQFSIAPNGDARAKGSFVSNSSPDLSETIAAAADVEAGDVVCADPEHAERVVRCRAGQRLLGAISDGTAWFLINARAHAIDAPLTGKPLVLAGRVPVKVSEENGPIQIGDLLAPGSKPGTAMRATAPGPTVGIALEASDGKNTVLCFVKAGEGNLAAALAQANERNQALTRELHTIESRLAKLEASASR